MTTSIRVLDLSGGIYFNRYEAENKAKMQSADAALGRAKKCHAAALVVTNTVMGYVVIEEEKDPTVELEQLQKEHKELEEKHEQLEREHEDCKSDDDVKEQVAEQLNEELRGVVGRLTEWGLKAGADANDVWPGLVEYPEAVEIIKGAALSFGLLPKQKTPDEAAEF
jgi:predicted nuclease with TOPRIM domain